jgi:hypothetical protein
MKESQPIPPAIAVSLATSLVAAPYLLIRNYYKVAPLSKGAYELINFLLCYGVAKNLAANPSQQAEMKKSFLINKVSFIAPT